MNINLENAVYSTEPGQIYPEPIKTQYGYHIIKVYEKKPRKTAIRAAHILAAFKSNQEGIDTSKAHERIEDIKKKLNDGENFSELARKYSDDRGSAENGGDLGFFERGAMVREFENVAFSLEPDQISDIVQTRFGYHIIKLIEIAPQPTFEDAKKDLKNVYQRTFYNSDYSHFIDSLKKELNYSMNKDTYERILENIDSIRIGEKYWENPVRNIFGSKYIFSLAGKNYSSDSLFAYAEVKRQYIDRPINETILNSLIDNYSSSKVIAEKALSYDQKDPEFAILMADYKNGIYLFKILEEEVWTKLLVDSIKVMEYYEQVKENYRWKDRVEYKEIRVASDSLANYIYAELQKGTEFDSLMAKHDKTRFDNNLGLSGLLEIETTELARKAFDLQKIGDFSKPINYQNNWSIIQLVKKEEPRIKTFSEVKMELAAIVQELETKRLEDEYINNLKNIYKPKFYYNELTKAFSK